MTTKHKTATKAGAAALPGAVLPTAAQLRRMACTLVADTLKGATAIDEWKDEYSVSISAVELAFHQVKELDYQVPDADAFETAWFRLHAVVMLALDAFPDQDTTTWRYLSYADKQFGVLIDAIDQAQARERKAEQAQPQVRPYVPEEDPDADIFCFIAVYGDGCGNADANARYAAWLAAKEGGAA